MLAGLATGSGCSAFTLQTHDPDRAGLRGLHQRRPARGPPRGPHRQGRVLRPRPRTGVGDVWQGIRQGVNEVAEVFVDIADTLDRDRHHPRRRRHERSCTLAWDDILGRRPRRRGGLRRHRRRHRRRPGLAEVGLRLRATSIAFAKSSTQSAFGELGPTWSGRCHGLLRTQGRTASSSAQEADGRTRSSPTSRNSVLPNAHRRQQPDPLGRYVHRRRQQPRRHPAPPDQAQGPHASWLTDKLTGATAEPGGRSRGAWCSTRT